MTRQATTAGPVRSWTPLDPFQELMLLWRSLYPYNAVHALVLRGDADAAAFRAAMESVCHGAGVGELVLDAGRRRLAWEPLREAPLRQLDPCVDPSDGLDEILTDELRRPFSDGPHHPLRWTLRRALDGSCHLLVLTYDHVVADAFAVQALLADVLAEYFGFPRTGPGTFIASAGTNGTRNRLRSLFAPLRVIGAGARMAGRYLRLRYAHRMHESRPRGDETAVACRSLPQELASRLRTHSTDHADVGWNDLFIAAAARAIAIHTPHRRTHRQRRFLALGTMCSLRERPLPGRPIAFTSRLVHRTVLLRRPDDDVAGVLKEVAGHTRPFKHHRACCTAIEPFALRRLWPLMGIRHDRNGYRKLFPLCGGVSTVAVDQRWYGQAADRILRVIRACPTGPVVPLVLAPTVRDNAVELALTYRTACLSASLAEALLDSIMAELGLLTNSRVGADASTPRESPVLLGSTAR